MHLGFRLSSPLYAKHEKLTFLEFKKFYEENLYLVEIKYLVGVNSIMQATGAIGKMLVSMNLNGSILSIFIIVAMTLLLSDVTSNTATAAVCMPLVVSMCAGQNLDPIPFIFIASIGVNISYMLPTSIRAIPVGYGLTRGYMLKEGYKLTIIVIILMSMLSWYLLNYTSWFKL